MMETGTGNVKGKVILVSSLFLSNFALLIVAFAEDKLGRVLVSFSLIQAP
ncbi:hypothetical protein CY0110_17552 [Crocosphaera chwakensis CCY0110]|uniref:Uncharacterized protein n=1 Tax=Crocosphaera chwakensis CCY0110 TaxID=391612 RepID=A3IIJ2_9CHRO|nr:hypothetical protein CY0110_17552 [Crocosphaera chwakensis CCY0110]